MNAPAPGPDLRDIHLPPPPSWWPPAPGWWLLALIVLVAAVFAARRLLRLQRARRWRRRVQAELDRIAATHAAQPDPARAAGEVSRLLRRVSRIIEPNAAALRGEDWLAFLDAQWPQRKSGASFRAAPGRALVDLPYRRHAETDAADVGALLDLARAWLAAVLAGRRPHA